MELKISLFIYLLLLFNYILWDKELFEIREKKIELKWCEKWLLNLRIFTFLYKKCFFFASVVMFLIDFDHNMLHLHCVNV